MYLRLAEHLRVTSASVQATHAVCMGYADAVQLDLVVFDMPGGATLTFEVQGSNDLQNWVTVDTRYAFAVGYQGPDPITNIAWAYVRILVSSDSATTSIIAIGLNSAQLGSSFRGIQRRLNKRLAEHLAVTSAKDEWFPSVSMDEADAVQLDMVVFVIPAFTTVTVEIQGSNDEENWTTLVISSATAVGYLGTIQATAIDWQYVRVGVRSDNASPSIVALGLRTAKLGSSLRDVEEESESGTYTRLAEHVSVTDGHDEATYHVRMGDANRVNVDLEVLASPGSPFATVVFYLDGSNDLQNWTNLAFNAAISEGFLTIEQGGIAFQYIRIRFLASGAMTPYIVAAGVNAIAA